MELQEFTQKVQKGVSVRLGAQYQVKIKQVRKNNNILLHGLLVQKEGQNVYPTIYLEQYYSRYKDGTPLSEVVDHIIEIYYRDAPEQVMDFRFFEDFQQVKGRICYRLIHKERNKQLLKQIPYVTYLDLAICFFYAYEDKRLGKGTILIYRNHMELWQVTVEDLMRYAIENTPRLYPGEVRSMEDMLRQLLQSEEMQREIPVPEDMPMMVVGNQSGCFGATVMLYGDFWEQLANDWQERFYILPSSIHEVILLKDDGQEDPVKLQEMVQEINHCEVDPTEVLSDSIYHYDRTDKVIRRIL
ncbi:MAG: hypothetical protein IJ327_03385 [Lachnospiraceae bacterium]|nr:hypothetical protein [Lachnospiraceae bacterium]